MEEEQIANIWKEYLEDLYGGNTDIKIMKSEFTKAMQELKLNKTTGLDEIPVELWKYGGERIKHVLFKMVEEIYLEGRLPKDFTRNKIICIPKKKKRK